jgi:hypothetical protein
MSADASGIRADGDTVNQRSGVRARSRRDSLAVLSYDGLFDHLDIPTRWLVRVGPRR